MNSKIYRRLFLAVILAALIPAITSATKSFLGVTPASDGGALSLVAPAFVASAQDSSDSRAGADFLTQQAGIAAYTNAGLPISIPSVRPLFRGVERMTDDYIIGSIKAPAYVGVPYDEEEVDPHAYIHKDGWIVAYYLKDTPAVHIVSWPKYEADKLTRNNLSDVISTTLDVLGVETFVVDYYDFRYPNADSLIVMTDGENTNGQTDTFTFKVPGASTVYERAWEFAAFNYEIGSNCKLNNETLHTNTECTDCWGVKQGILTDIQLRPDVLYTVSIKRESDFHRYIGWTYCAIGLVYREAP